MEQVTTVGILWVGLDAHSKSISVAAMIDWRSEVAEWEIQNSEASVVRLAKRLRKMAGSGEIRCCYEAGPLGFTLQRQLEERREGIVCEVIAPSLIPRRPGDRVKTDRRDARQLVKLSRAGNLTQVHAPSAQDEAVRDLCRCRSDAVEDRTRARHRLSKFLLRKGLRWHGKSSWTLNHHDWLRNLHFEQPADRIVFADYRRTVEAADDRVKDLTAQIDEFSKTDPYRAPVSRLRCFRGIDTLIAMTIVTELHGFARFRTPRELMSYLGLTPSESSSGEKTRRGGITKTGNGHVRRALVEAAWCQRTRPQASRALKKRREGNPEWVITIADRAMRRLHQRYARLAAKKPPNKAVTAVARELAGFIWATLCEPTLRPSDTPTSAA